MVDLWKWSGREVLLKYIYMYIYIYCIYIYIERRVDMWGERDRDRLTDREREND